MGICSFALLLFSLFLSMLIKKERPWANHSRCSLKKSDRERITIVALYKRVSWVNRSLAFLKKSDMSDLLMIRANSLQKIVIHITSYKKATMSDSFRSLFKKKRKSELFVFSEWIALSLFCSQKKSNLLKEPKSEFPTLITTDDNILKVLLRV